MEESAQTFTLEVSGGGAVPGRGALGLSRNIQLCKRLGDVLLKLFNQ